MEKEILIKRNKSNSIILTVLGIATLLVAIVGASFSYFTATLTGDTTTSSVIIKTAVVSIAYNDGPAINTTLFPSKTMNGTTKTFTITNPTTYDAKVTMTWQNVTNTFGTPASLVYKIDCTNTPAGGAPVNLSETAMPTTATASIVGFNNRVIPKNTVQTCILSYRYNDNDAVQNPDMDKQFAGKLKIVAEQTSPQ